MASPTASSPGSASPWSRCSTRRARSTRRPPPTTPPGWSRPASRPIVVAGTTGEAATLDDEERSDLLIAVRSTPSTAGCRCSPAPARRRRRQAVLLSKRAEDDGADALLVLSPAGVPDPRPYYERVAASVDVPVLAYHYPKASAPGVPVDVLGQLPVSGIKDSSGDAERLILEADEIPAGLYTGPPDAHPPRRRHRLLGRHPRPRQRRPRGLPPRLGRRRHRPARAHQRPPRPGARRHRRPQAHPLRPPRHLPRHPSRVTPPACVESVSSALRSNTG